MHDRAAFWRGRSKKVNHVIALRSSILKLVSEEWTEEYDISTDGSGKGSCFCGKRPRTLEDDKLDTTAPGRAHA